MSRLFLLAVVISSLGAMQRAYADGAIPKFDVAKNCRAEVGYALSIGQTEAACVNDEQKSREALASEWSKFSQATKASCLHETMIGTPSYVELRTCLEMTKWAGRSQ